VNVGRCVLGVAFTVLFVTSMARQAAAQEAGDTVLTPIQRVDPPMQGVSPRGAMIRSFALWGWGQGAVGSYFRGGVWFSMEASTVYMLFRTIGRLRTAQEFNRRVETFARDSLDRIIERDTSIVRRVLTSPVQEDLTNPQTYEAAVSEAPGVATARKLVSARKQQRQDWVTYAIFFTLMSGVDAYVNAHAMPLLAARSSTARLNPCCGSGGRRYLGASARRPRAIETRVLPADFGAHSESRSLSPSL
jgi:hypothetical protein